MGGKGGGKKGGGGGGSIEVDVDSDSDSSMVLDIVGLDDVQVTTTSTSTNTNRLELPDPIDTRITLNVPDTIRTDQNQRNELAITEPIVTQMSADLDVDVKPIVLDLCLTVGIKELPRFCISRPYDKHVGLTLFGREVIGFNWCGTSDFIIDDVRPRAFVSGATDAPMHAPRAGPHRHDDHDHYQDHDHHDHDHDHHDDHGSGGRRGSGVRFVID
jgi:hypothetical protein